MWQRACSLPDHVLLILNYADSCEDEECDLALVGGIGDHICKDKEYEIVRETESREVRWLNY